MNFHLIESMHQLKMSEMSDKINEKGRRFQLRFVDSDHSQPGDKDEGNGARQKLL